MNPAQAIVSTASSHGAWLDALDANWPATVCSELEHSQHVVRVVIARVKGSSPRESGACMLLTARRTFGTIGGGYLEHESLQIAHELLRDTGAASVRVRHFVLGRELGQCCGGAVDIWFERYSRADLHWLRTAAEAVRSRKEFALISSCKNWSSAEAGGSVKHRVIPHSHVAAKQPIPAPASARTQLSNEDGFELVERLDSPATPLWLYGAGHVGQALVRVLADLPFAVTWIDSRCELLPELVPANVEVLHTEEVVASVDAAPADAHYLIMTHDHALDYALCKAILARDHVAFVGLIGSKSKSARFRSRLRHDGFADERILQLTSPIGIGAIDSKLPAAIAVSVAAQLLERICPRQSVVGSQREPEPCSASDCSSCRRSSR